MASGQWSGPVCLQTLAMTLGPQIGFRKSDTLLCLLDDGAIAVFSKAIAGFGQIKLGGQLAVAAGPVGRDAALDARAAAYVRRSLRRYQDYVWAHGRTFVAKGPVDR